MEITEGNILIAKFMGAKCTLEPINGYLVCSFTNADIPANSPSNFWMPKYMLYHSSWDWLMKVVDKIESMKAVSVNIHNDYCGITCGLFRPKFAISNLFNSKIESTWHSVIEFIQYYNNHNNENSKETS
jgi:hypothetical protein